VVLLCTIFFSFFLPEMKGIYSTCKILCTDGFPHWTKLGSISIAVEDFSFVDMVHGTGTTKLFSYLKHMQLLRICGCLLKIPSSPQLYSAR
jgi:hypothetical protein